MKKSFVIIWKSASSERCGRGKKLMTEEEAEALAAELNHDHPAFLHSVADTEAEAAGVETAKAA